MVLATVGTMEDETKMVSVLLLHTATKGLNSSLINAYSAKGVKQKPYHCIQVQKG